MIATIAMNAMKHAMNAVKNAANATKNAMDAMTHAMNAVKNAANAKKNAMNAMNTTKYAMNAMNAAGNAMNAIKNAVEDAMRNAPRGSHATGQMSGKTEGTKTVVWQVTNARPPGSRRPDYPAAAWAAQHRHLTPACQSDSNSTVPVAPSCSESRRSPTPEHKLPSCQQT